MFLCGPFWLQSGPSSLEPAASVMEFSQQRASRGKVVPSCQLHLGKITLEPAPASLSPSREQSAPPQKGGEDRLRNGGNFHFSRWLGRLWHQVPPLYVGRLMCILTGFQKSLRGALGKHSSAGPELKGGEAGVRKQRPSALLLLPSPGVIQLSVLLQK